MKKKTMKTVKMEQNEITTTRAAGLALRYTWLTVRGMARGVNRFVHRWPWLVIFMVVAASVATSFAMIGAARVERDQASAQSYRYEQTLDSLSVAMELHGMKYKRQ